MSGRIGIVDGDVVDETNLQRQTLFATADIGRNKARVAAERLGALNPSIALDVVPLYLDAGNARELVGLYDAVIDCTDRFATRYLVNDACFFENKADVYGSIFRFDGQVSVFATRDGPCYRCLYPEPPPVDSMPSCAEGGVLGALAGIVGAWQASETLKLLLGIGQPLIGRMMLIETLEARVREVRFDRDLDCVLCGRVATVLDVEALPESPAYDGWGEEIAAEGLDDALRTARLLDVRETHEAVLGSIDGAVAIPASQLEARMHELDTSVRYVVACRVGSKSQWAVARLRQTGFAHVVHLRGGLLAYAAQHPDFAFF